LFVVNVFGTIVNMYTLPLRSPPLMD